MDRAYLQGRITATKALIEAYETAVTELGVAGGVQSYTLDTGQSRQTVTRADIPALNRMIDSLYNRLATLQARLYGGTVTARPAW
jgi:hypothetical protein